MIKDVIDNQSISQKYDFVEVDEIWHFLARFRRKGKCYSKSKEMVEYSLYILFYSGL